MSDSNEEVEAEEEGAVARCPFCEATGSCPHLAASLDRSFGCWDGGVFVRRREELEAVAKRCLRRLLDGAAARPATLARFADFSSVSDDLQALWRQAKAYERKGGDGATLCLENDADDHLMCFAVRAAGLEGDDSTAYGPCCESVLTVFHDRDPNAEFDGVLRELENTLLAWLMSVEEEPERMKTSRKEAPRRKRRAPKRARRSGQ